MSDYSVHCAHCHQPIEGRAVTALGGGWVHTGSNSELCVPGATLLAAPPILEDA